MDCDVWINESVSYKAVRSLASYIILSRTFRLVSKGMLYIFNSAHAVIEHSGSRRFFDGMLLAPCLVCGGALDRVFSICKSSFFAQILNKKV